jgi:hypothetical protein
VAVFRDERERRRDLPAGEAAELPWRVLDEVAVELEHGRGVVELVEERTAVNLLDRVEPVLERRDDAEVPAAAPQRPEQVLVLAVARSHSAPVGGDDLGGDEVVAGKAEAAGQVAHSAAECEPADARRRDHPGGRREPVLVRRVVEDA